MLIYPQSGLLGHLLYLPHLTSLRLLKQEGAPYQFFPPEPPPGFRLLDRKQYFDVPTWVNPGLTPEKIARLCTDHQMGGSLKKMNPELTPKDLATRCNEDQYCGSLKYIMIDQVAFEVVRGAPCTYRRLNRDEIRAIPIFAIREEVGICGLTVLEH